MRAKLTKRVVDAAEPTDREAFIWDAGDGATKGFGLKVTPKGRKVYVYQYRIGGRQGKTERYTIGEHGQPWTVDQARERAKALQRMVAERASPNKADKERIEAAKRQEAADAEAMARRFDVVAERYIKSQLPRYDNAAADESILRRRFLTRWGQRDIALIRKVDVVAALDGIVEEGYPAAALKARRVLSPLFEYAIGRGLMENNPALRIKLDVTTAPRRRVLSDNEIRLVWQSASALYYPNCHYVRLLMLTGQRRTEIATINVRTELSLIDNALIFSAEKMKSDRAHVVPLAPAALAVVEEALERQSGDYLFTSNGRSPIVGYSYIKDELDKTIAEMMEAEGGEGCPPMPHWIFHDLRRTMRTGMSALRVPPHIAERCIAHKPKDQTATEMIYDQWEYLDERRDAMERWGRRVMQVVEGRGQAGG